jgi:hypothetical protein
MYDKKRAGRSNPAFSDNRIRTGAAIMIAMKRESRIPVRVPKAKAALALRKA